MGTSGRRNGYILMTINYYQQNADSFVASTVAVDMTSLYAPFIGAIEPNLSLIHI